MILKDGRISASCNLGTIDDTQLSPARLIYLRTAVSLKQHRQLLAFCLRGLTGDWRRIGMLILSQAFMVQ